MSLPLHSPLCCACTQLQTCTPTVHNFVNFPVVMLVSRLFCFIMLPRPGSPIPLAPSISKIFEKWTDFTNLSNVLTIFRQKEPRFSLSAYIHARTRDSPRPVTAALVPHIQVGSRYLPMPVLPRFQCWQMISGQPANRRTWTGVPANRHT